MKHVFTSLIIKLPLISHILIMAVFFMVIFFSLPYIPNYQSWDFKWFFSIAGITVALLAQIYTKLQDTKFIANASISELNRIADSVNVRTKAVIKLIFFHLIFGICNFLIFAIPLPDVYKQAVIAICLSFVVLWVITLLFGYTLYQEMADLNAELLKRKIQHEHRQATLKKLS